MSAEEIKKSLELFVAPGGVCELRVLGGRVRENGGYFNDLAKMAEIANVLDKGGAQDGIFFTLNEIKPDLLARYNNRLCQTRKPELTKGSDVIKRRWLYVDIDIKGKLSGISSRDSEHAEALEEAATFARRMTDDFGWPEPVYCDSGNGAHLQYRIDLPNEKDSTELVKKTLVALDHIFNHPRLNIDSSTNDPNRIAKLYGTMVRKGEEVDDRHHRQSRIITVPDELVVLAKEQMEELVKLHEAAVGPVEAEPQPYSGLPGMIDDMGVWLEGHGLTWKKTKGSEVGGTIYVLDDCPGCHDQKGSCQVTKFKPPKDGQHAKCHHSSCPVKNWQSLRAIVEPEFKAKPQQPRQERDQNRRARPEMPELDLEDIAIPETRGKGDDAETAWKFSPSRAADSIIQRFDIITTEDNKIWVYRDGYYSAEWWVQIVDLVNNIAGDIFLVRMEKELEAKVRSKTRAKEEIFNNNPYLACVKNCTIDLLAGVGREHSPEDYLTDQLPITYDPTKPCHEFIKYLESITPNAIDRLTLVDYLVTMLIRRPFPYVLFLLGLGRNGKGVYEDIMNALFGIKNVRQIPPAELSKNTFAKGYIQNARASVASEEEGDEGKMVIGTSFMKQASGKGVIDTDVKNKDRKQFLAVCQFVVFSNTMPFIKDQSMGWIERFIKIDLPYIFVSNPINPLEKKRDDDLAEKITSPDELSGILNLLMFRAKAIGKSNTIIKRPGREMFDEYAKQSNSLQTFWEAFCENAADSFEVAYCTEDLHKNYYTKWCIATGSDMAALKDFGGFLKRNCGRRPPVKRSFPEYSDIRKYGYTGLSFDRELCLSVITSSIKDKETDYSLSKSECKENIGSVVDSGCPGCPSGLSEIWRFMCKGTFTLTSYRGVQNHAVQTDNRTIDDKRPLENENVENHSDQKPDIDSSEPIVYKERGGKHKADLVCGRILQDQVVDGILYKADQVVYLEKRIAEQLYMKPIKSAGCKSCGKPVVPWGGREDFCKACYREMAQVKDEEVISMSVLGPNQGNAERSMP
jgi:phage/plasmid-associated DNA primase